MLPDIRLVIAAIATAVMVVTLGLGTIAAFRTGEVNGLPPMARRTDSTFVDLGVRRQIPDLAAARNDLGNDGGLNGSWTAVTAPEDARAPASARVAPGPTDSVVIGALGALPEAHEGRGFFDPRVIVDAPSVIAGDPKSPTIAATIATTERHDDGIAAASSSAAAHEAARNAPTAAIAAIAVPRKVAPLAAGAVAAARRPTAAAPASSEMPTQRSSLRDAVENDRSSEIALASLAPAPSRKPGAQAAAKALQPKTPVGSPKTRKARLVHRFRPMNGNFTASDGYVPVFGPEQTFGPTRF
jgi:hypothetical protein